MTAPEQPQRPREHRLPRLRRSGAAAEAARVSEPEATRAADVHTQHTAPVARRAPKPDAPTDMTAAESVQPPNEGGRRGSIGGSTRESDREMIGRFAIIERIGEGGMGVVYRAVDTADSRGRQVAVKVLRPHIAYDSDARRRLAREVDTLERVHHRNIAAVIDADPMGPRPFIATEFVPGKPLSDVIDERGAFTPTQLADLGRDLAEAVDAIHAAGVVHRDIKPSNVLMVGDTPVLIDFGIAHIADDARLTSTGLVMGTPGYLSPEVVEGAPVSRSTDWWGWAATLAYAAQGEPPFGRGAMAAVLDRVTRGQANLSGVDDRLRPLLAAALSPVPAERPSAQEVIDQMSRYARGESTTIVPVRDIPARDAVVPATAQLARPDATRIAPTARPTQTTPAPAATPQRSYPQQHVPAPEPRRTRDAEAVYSADRYGRNDNPYQYPDANQSSHGARGSAPAGVRPQTRPGENDPRINLPLRSGTLQALFFAWVAFTALVPVLGLVALALWNIAARFTDFTLTQAVMRRYEAGRRKSDSAVAVASSPWHLLRATVSTLFALLLPLFVAACVAVVVGVGYAALTGGVPRMFWAVPLIPAALAGQWVMWRGAAATSYRRGARSLIRGMIPDGRSYDRPGDSSAVKKSAVTVLVALGCLMLLGSFLQGGGVSWTPLSGGFVDPLSRYLPN